jgi:hypothetical protein
MREALGLILAQKKEKRQKKNLSPKMPTTIIYFPHEATVWARLGGIGSVLFHMVSIVATELQLEVPLQDGSRI